jgi:hypothetical protein
VIVVKPLPVAAYDAYVAQRQASNPIEIQPGDAAKD